MPFPEHYLCQFGGDFISEPTEVWSNTLRFSPGGGTNGPNIVGMSNAQQTAASLAIYTRLIAFLNVATNPYSANVRLKFVKFNRIDDQGAYNDKSTTNATYTSSAGSPGSGATEHPVTAALVVTWLTSVQRGPASRGRIFVPQPSVTTNAGSNYRIAANVRTAMVASFRQLLLDLRADVVTAGGIGLAPSVVSEVGAGGSARQIERVQIGDFLDYMGSRRNNLIEGRTSSAVIAPSG